MTAEKLRIVEDHAGATEHRADTICRGLDRARGDEVPEALLEVFACFSFPTARPEGTLPSEEQLERLLASRNAARTHINQVLRPHLPFERIKRGFDALTGLLIHWTESAELTAARSPDIVPDLCNYAEIFRNDVHSVVLQRAIDQRKWARVDDVIAELHPAFGDEGAA